MKTLAEFVEEYDGQFVNFDTVYGAQCMDLFRCYVREVLGFPQSAGVSNAWQVFSNFDPALWEKIPYKKSLFPSPGCVIIWSKWYSIKLTGHIAVYVRPGEKKPLLCFSQNDPGGKPATLKEYNFDRVLGWLRPKVEPVPPDVPVVITP